MIAADIRDTPADNATPLGRNASATDPISPDGRPEPGRLYTVPAREGRAVRLKAGEHLTVVNPHGTQVCDLWAFSAANPAEFLSWGLTTVRRSPAFRRTARPSRAGTV